MNGRKLLLPLRDGRNFKICSCYRPGHIAVMLGLGNTVSNSIWEARMRGVKPNPQSSREEKERWIRTKYENKEFLALPPSAAPLGQQLVDAVCRSDLKTTALVLARCGADDVNCSVSGRDLRTPLHLASTLGHLALVQILLWVSRRFVNILTNSHSFFQNSLHLTA